jgi:hypothetical protein
LCRHAAARTVCCWAVLPPVVLCAFTLGRASAASPSARLVYSRAPGATSCPNEAALREAVARRFGYDPFFPWAERTVVVEIRMESGRLSARLQVLGKDGVSQGTRQISATQEDCAEVFDATALAITIALDAAQSDAPSPPVSVPDTATVSPPAMTSSRASSEQAPALPSTTRTAPPAGAPEAAPSSPRLRPFFAGTDGYASFGTAPSVAAGGALFVGARFSFVSTALEVRFDAPASAPLQSGSVSSWLYAGSLVPCAHYLFVSLCAVGMVGSLQGSGEARVSTPGSTLFAALGGRLGVEWGLTEAFAVRGHVDLLGNLAPTTLAIDSFSWTASSLAFSIGAGLVLRFP